jgi:pimeloyl-ACP methyl ester carboxylesterase
MRPSVVVSLSRATFDLPGGTFHALVGGSPTARPLVFLHGFPDHPPTAARFLEQLGRTRRVIAPWLRGYSPSPLGGPYDLDRLAGDVIELIDALAGGPDPRVDLVGHDWGAVITYAVCGAVPERIRRAVTMAVPHPSTFLRMLATPAQARRSWYMGLLQLPGASWLVQRNDFALIDRLWHTWSPGFALEPEQRAELHACLAASMPAPIEYYRAMLRPLTTFRERTRRAAVTIGSPLLQLHGGQDRCILPPTNEDRARDARYFTERVVEVYPSHGHFLHVEAPEAVGMRVRDWLA